MGENNYESSRCVVGADHTGNSNFIFEKVLKQVSSKEHNVVVWDPWQTKKWTSIKGCDVVDFTLSSIVCRLTKHKREVELTEKYYVDYSDTISDLIRKIKPMICVLELPSQMGNGKFAYENQCMTVFFQNAESYHITFLISAQNQDILRKFQVPIWFETTELTPKRKNVERSQESPAIEVSPQRYRESNEITMSMDTFMALMKSRLVDSKVDDDSDAPHQQLKKHEKKEGDKFMGEAKTSDFITCSSSLPGLSYFDKAYTENHTLEHINEHVLG